jgi:putative endonuclease
VLHLEREGYVVVERNLRCAGAEIDIVAQDGDVLCFIEVRRRARAGDALMSVSETKRARITRAASAYLQRRRIAPRCRFDVVAVAGERVHLVRAAFEATFEVRS